jgi:hypothetical protein
VFNFFRLHQNRPIPPPETLESPEYANDGLNQEVTKIALDIINGDGGEIYLGAFIRAFRNVPGLMEDVAPEHREALRQAIATYAPSENL